MTQQLYTRSTSRRARHQTTPRLKSFIHRSRPWWRNPYFWAAGWGLAMVSLFFNVRSYSQVSAANTQDLCQQTIQSSAVLSRAQLAKILTLPERSNQDAIKGIVLEPYCQLPNLELRDGVIAEREAYPLAFDPTTWLVVLYEGGEYAGFDFSFQ
ncbi:MAG: hypothetical protein AAGF93_22070 [Cyanobacteria bacterium P01_H01_bin.105]